LTSKHKNHILVLVCFLCRFCVHFLIRKWNWVEINKISNWALGWRSPSGSCLRAYWAGCINRKPVKFR
jgi:hypothetical protein